MGAGVSGSDPDWVFGNAITSRMLSSPASRADEAIETEREAGVRRRAVAERVEQESEVRLRLLLIDAEQSEDPGLNVASWIRTLPEPSSHPLSTKS